MKALLMTGAAGWLTLHHLGRTYGSTRYERVHPLPGDDLVDDAQTVVTHAVTLAAILEPNRGDRAKASGATSQ